MLKLEYDPESAASLLAELSRTDDRLHRRADILPHIYEIVTDTADRTGEEPMLPPDFMATLTSLPSDTLADLYVRTSEIIDDATDPLQWSRRVLKRALEIKMEERRKERGPDDHAPIAIPHPTLTIENKVDFEPYAFDVDQIFEGLRGLPEDEIEKLLRIEPEREEYVLPLDGGQVAAIKLAILALREGDSVERSAAPTLESLLEKRTIPGTISVKSTATLLAWLRRNAGSERAKIVAQGVRRRVLGNVTTIKPKTIAKRVDPIIPQPAIATEGAA